jgi:hypothetical protein
VLAPSDQEQAATPSAKHKAFSFRPTGRHPPTPHLAELSEPLVEKLLARGESHLAQGNIASAGHSSGTLRKPVSRPEQPCLLCPMTGRASASESRGRRNEARSWYQRARELGAPDDPSLFTGCKC